MFLGLRVRIPPWPPNESNKMNEYDLVGLIFAIGFIGICLIILLGS